MFMTFESLVGGPGVLHRYISNRKRLSQRLRAIAQAPCRKYGDAWPDMSMQLVDVRCALATLPRRTEQPIAASLVRDTGERREAGRFRPCPVACADTTVSGTTTSLERE